MKDPFDTGDKIAVFKIRSRNFTFGEDSLALRLASELADLRAANANRFSAPCATSAIDKRVAAPKHKKTQKRDYFFLGPPPTPPADEALVVLPPFFSVAHPPTFILVFLVFCGPPPPPGIGPGMKVLQTSALPLGYGALFC